MGTPMFAGFATPKLNTLTSNNATSNIGDSDIRNFTEEDLKLEQISEQIREYFASRQISVDTLQRNGVMQTRRNNKAVIAFTYRRTGKIVNCKYRNLQKLYWQEKNAEKVPYGLDDIKEARAIIIVEGEIDKLSMEEAGYKNCISVPDGAPIKVSTKDLPPIEKDKKYEYLWNFKEYFDQASRIILATDADEPGHALAEELARRLGRERCWRVTWPRKSETTNELCKDANEVLICLGNQALKEVIESAELYIIQELF
jgi:twinkle protein